MWHHESMTEEDLKAVVKTYDDTIEDARRVRDAAITKAAGEGMRQVDIIKATGYSRETIRRITQAGKDSG